ncbi:hypothetical protein X943_002598 [Babesia divergens]|uniref:Uncharacterized protein n=1 Tax=Babesia divergens TaxID=32595 RepID=A0AAD9LH57_BABDI|nr:hypothetical protein X943_002598 [Babesia divergens]
MVESDSDHNVPVDRGGTSGAKPSASLYRSIKGLTNAKLIHLAKRLLAENTPKSYNEALEIAVLFMRSIPPMGYLAEDLFLLFIRLFQSNDGCDTLFLKFLSIAGASTPFLRPLIMAHGARFLASKGRFYDMKHQIHRNCTEWNLEKHQTAKYYKWIVQHAEELGRTGDKYSSDYRVELEHILMTHADLRVLPNASIFQLFIESHAEYPNKVATVLNHFIELFPNVHFLRKYRVENCGDEGSVSPVERDQ